MDLTEDGKITQKNQVSICPNLAHTCRPVPLLPIDSEHRLECQGITYMVHSPLCTSKGARQGRADLGGLVSAFLCETAKAQDFNSQLSKVLLFGQFHISTCNLHYSVQLEICFCLSQPLPFPGIN